ncbi:MAG: hypothetical protein HQM08_13745 [Candidatus Riflebacteria bacterium]|nr:hypothetical protein [Candidatus Riflebacteria bacterium]
MKRNFYRSSMFSLIFVLWIAFPGKTASPELPRRGFFGAQVEVAPAVGRRCEKI